MAQAMETTGGRHAPENYPAAAPPATARTRGRNIQSVDRVLSIIEVLSLSEKPLMLRDIAALSDLNLSTCHHLVNTLVRRGYVINAGRAQGYSLSSKFEILSRRSEREAKLVEFVTPALRELHEDILENVQMTVLRGSSLLDYVRFSPRMGGRISHFGEGPVSRAAHAVANGKAILAWLPESELARVVADNGLSAFTPNTITTLAGLTEELRLVRRSGFSVEDGEFLRGQSGVAATLRDMSGAVVGSIGVSINRKRANAGYRDYLARAVMKCAKEISGRMPAGCFH